MRDSHKLKEKYELSLESSQIVTLTVAGLVVLGGVFVLGVVVGKKLSAEPVAQAQPQDLLTALDEKTKALEAKPDASLTFQAELTKAAPAQPKEKPAEQTKPVEVAKSAEAAKPTEPAKVAEAPKPAEEQHAEPSPSPVAAAEPVEPPKPPEPAAKPKVADVKLAEQVKVEPTPARTNDAGALKEAFARGIKAAPPEAPAAQAPGGGFSLQLSAYQDRAEADRFAAGLRDKGYAPFVVEATVGGKGTWFRVRMGKFTSREAAQRYLTDFKRETSLDAFVTSN